jgi:hypothetical protein
MLITSIVLFLIAGFFLRAGIGNLIKALVSAMVQIKDGKYLYVVFETPLLWTVFGFILLGVAIAFLTASLI